ncbi:MAG: FAD-dependent oxidoreductase, partial [Verrucomicrobiaceae bacterium]
ACISHWPVRAGVRESRRWKGQHVLTEAEVLAGTRHEDDIALATWPLEFRETNRGPKLRYPQDDRAAGIPLGCLMPESLDGVFVAGRCVSCDHGAQASVRVMGTCFATGQAAGLSAAMVADGKPENLAQAIRKKFPFGG